MFAGHSVAGFYLFLTIAIARNADDGQAWLMMAKLAFPTTERSASVTRDKPSDAGVTSLPNMLITHHLGEITMTVSISKSTRDPRGHCLSTELQVTEPRQQVFEFFADAFQLETITPPWLHFSVETPRPIDMCNGTLIDYKLRLHGLPIRWRSRISLLKPPFQFVDEQVKGPYRYWHHLHTFDDAEGGTLIRDLVHYAVPLGFITHPLLVRRDLTRIFGFRREEMCRIFSPVGRNS